MLVVLVSPETELSKQSSPPFALHVSREVIPDNKCKGLITTGRLQHLEETIGQHSSRGPANPTWLISRPSTEATSSLSPKLVNLQDLHLLKAPEVKHICPVVIDSLYKQQKIKRQMRENRGVRTISPVLRLIFAVAF